MTPTAAPPVDRTDVRVAGTQVLIVLVAALLGITNSPVLAAEPVWPAAVSVPVLAVAAGAVVLRRRAPLVVLLVLLPVGLAEVSFGSQVAAYLLIFEALFEPVMHGGRRLARAATATGIGLVVLAVAVAWGLGGSGPSLVLVLLVAVMALVLPLLWAWEVRHHRLARGVAEDLVRAEHALAASRAAHEVERERRRIAHDLHDVVAGHLTAVSLHATLAADLEDTAARDRSLATARGSAHAALRDLHAMIGVLTDPVPDGAPAGDPLPRPTLSWDALADRLRGGDPAAHVVVDPEVTDPDRIDPAAGAAALRIGAEAVTNAVRHGAAPLSLHVRRTADGLALSVTSARRGPAGPGADAGAEGPGPGTGVGLRALADRARAVGGTATAGPDPADPLRWRVEALLPHRTPVPEPDPDPEVHPESEVSR